MTAIKLTNTEIEDILQNMSAAELWQLDADVEPIQSHYSKEEIEKSKKIYDLMDLTDLEYADIECLLYEPHKARLCDIQVYCHALNINVLEFVQKSLQKNKDSKKEWGQLKQAA